MRHGQSDIIFVIESARDPCNCPSWNDLFYENKLHSADSVAFVATHIEPQVHFVKIHVKGTGTPKTLGLQKKATT